MQVLFPRVTIAVVCLNEEKNIVSCLKSILAQSYDPKRYEILVVDNNSWDSTRKLVKKIQKTSKRSLKLVINYKKGIASSRNFAFRAAKGELIAFTDADCEVPRDWLSRLIEGYQKYKKLDLKVVAVGGGNIPPKNTAYYQALGLMLNTFLGSRGSVQGKNFVKDKDVSHLPCANVLYERKKIKEIGGFDERLGSIIEDEDLSYRLLKRGYRFVYLANTEVIHKMRENLTLWSKNMFVYGMGRMWFLRKYPEKWSFLFILPIILVLTFPVSLPFYLPIMLLYSFYLSLTNHKLKLTFIILRAYFATHFYYGLGEIYGIFRPMMTKQVKD